jgi:hypothetical protein
MNNQEITDYRLLYAREDQITEEVIRFINAKKGWQPYGSPFKMGTVDDEMKKPNKPSHPSPLRLLRWFRLIDLGWMDYYVVYYFA